MSEALELKDSIIDQLRRGFSKRDSYPLSVSDTTSDLKINLAQTIHLNPNLDYEIALIRFEAYNSI